MCPKPVRPGQGQAILLEGSRRVPPALAGVRAKQLRTLFGFLLQLCLFSPCTDWFCHFLGQCGFMYIYFLL